VLLLTLSTYNGVNPLGTDFKFALPLVCTNSNKSPTTVPVGIDIEDADKLVDVPTIDNEFNTCIDGVIEAVGVGVGVIVGDNDIVGVIVGEGVAVADTDGVLDIVGVIVGVVDIVGVIVGVLDNVGVTVGDNDIVGVIVGDNDIVGVIVGVIDIVGVIVGVVDIVGVNDISGVACIGPTDGVIAGTTILVCSVGSTNSCKDGLVFLYWYLLSVDTCIQYPLRPRNLNNLGGISVPLLSYVIRW
jgi:hypothetical protein